MPKNLVQVKVTVGKKLDGTLIRKSFYGHSKREANEKAQAYLHSSTVTQVDKSIQLKEWAEKWLEVYKRGNVSEVTFQHSYYAPVHRHIIPYFNNALLVNIQQIDVQAFFNSKSHYSKSTLKKIKDSLNGIFESAIDNNIIIKNPMKSVVIASKAAPTKKRAYTAAQAQQVIEFARTHPAGAPIITLLKTGLRRGELVALRWKDIDFENNLIHVRQSVAEVNGAMTIGPPKTAASIADLPLAAELKSILTALPRSISGFVFPNTKDKLMNPTVWSTRTYALFMRDMNEAHPDIPMLTIHELRHTFGSLVYEASKDIYVTSKLMRHSSIEITAKIYVHESMDTKREALEKAFPNKSVLQLS